MPTPLDAIRTPALVLDAPKLRANSQRVSERLRPSGVRLRPHVKTHKSIDVARVQLGDRPAAATVSTLAEAEHFFEHGVTDLMYAVGIVPSKLGRVADLMRRGATVHLILDDPGVAEAAAAAGRRLGVEFLVHIELDVDGHRSGVAPTSDTLLTIAEWLRPDDGARLVGVVTHAGESYEQGSVEAIRQMADEERAGAVQAAERLRAAGHACPEVSVGSSPTAALGERFDGLTEVRCGVYAFWDLFQSNLGVCGVDDIAISVLTTVIGHQRDRGWLITDSGSLALSKDRGTAGQRVNYEYGQVADLDGRPIPGLLVQKANQEHGILMSRDGAIDFERFPIDSRLRVLPIHACLTAACHAGYHVTEGGREAIDYWPRIGGW